MIAFVSDHPFDIASAVAQTAGKSLSVINEVVPILAFMSVLILGMAAAVNSCCTNAVLAALVVLLPVVSVTTVIFPPASLLATLSAVAVVAVSSLVIYLFVELGVPLVPARASCISSVIC